MTMNAQRRFAAISASGPVRHINVTEPEAADLSIGSEVNKTVIRCIHIRIIDLVWVTGED